MLTPVEVASLILTYYTQDPQKAAATVMDGLTAAGYAVVNKDLYLGQMATMAALALDASNKVAAQ